MPTLVHELSRRYRPLRPPRGGHPGPGAIIAFDSAAHHGQWVLLESADPHRPSPLWMRCGNAQRRLQRIVYGRALWGTAPILVVPVEQNMPCGMRVDVFGVERTVFPAALVPWWLITATTIVGKIPGDVLGHVIGRHVAWPGSDSPGLTAQDRAFQQRIISMRAWVETKLAL